MILISGLLENVFINKQKNISLRKYTAYYLPNFVSSNNKKEIYFNKKDFFLPVWNFIQQIRIITPRKDKALKII